MRMKRDNELPAWVVERCLDAAKITLEQSVGDDCRIGISRGEYMHAALRELLAILEERGLRVVPANSIEGDCPDCGGSGWCITPVCCGRPSPHGDCCGNAVAGRATCQCGGGGRIQYCPAPPLAELLESPDSPVNGHQGGQAPCAQGS